jgi:hypothetical protein
MRVLKHDGSQHHGIGIIPTHPVERTVAGVREGRDEFLEYALELMLTLDVNTEPTTVTSYALEQNFPNPFNPLTTIEFNLPKTEFVTLEVYNILGKKVTTIVSNKLSAGNHRFNFDGSNLASGIYFCKLTTDSYQATRKMILMK